ncbi:alpha/beta hydrolase [Microbacterium sp. zg.Y625]|uniref:alpha/beta hydrolase n=1 Tax=Microbacterium jiangjiandongii TaxID=3049071 RepID=UPI00214C7480|nr:MULTISPECIES: alpha/beta hydrolase [unclassified Microbacterium]MCR2793709.1 alpha/beta hydrolase [Microbacterium sp. zg.Y625]WIM26056.1 alpha/beta hydrolase [Microbacterium sp. zg-Y625]
MPGTHRSRGRRVLRWVLGSVAGLLVVAVVGVVIWSQVGVMAAEPEPLEAVSADERITVTDDPGAIVLSPADGDSDTGLVFIPGAKVGPWAYAALLAGAVAENDLTVVITKPWLNLAFFDPRPLDTFTEPEPDVDTWIVGGHSLGGVRACQLADDADALVLFASYCATDLSDADLAVLSLAGTQDGLSTPQKIADARGLLPDDAELVEIDGASHASFGDYGPQAGDGEPTIGDEEMRALVTAELAGLVGSLTP